MKVGLIPNIGTIEALLSNVPETELATANSSHVMVEDVMTDCPRGAEVANISVAVKNYILNKELRGQTQVLLGIQDKQTVSTIFALFNGLEFSPWIEVSFSQKFMSGDVGPKVAFATGIGFLPDVNIYEAIPALNKIKSFLKEINYKGEILCGVSEDYMITSLDFGHFFAHFAMYAELATNRGSLFEFLFGKRNLCEVNDSVSLANLVSVAPFPYLIPNMPCVKIQAPTNAEKHLWRIRQFMLDTVLITVHGCHVWEAKRRMRRTLDNMQKYDSSLMFRIDYGNKAKFVLCKEKYELLFNPKLKEGVHPVGEGSPKG